MESVPKIVVDRLRVATPVSGHPEADVLTAFAERSLSERERGTVMEHLSRCGDCREVVALAVPEMDSAAPVQVPARGGWLTWPVLRWGLVTAGIVTISAVGVLQFGTHSALKIAVNAPPAGYTANQSPASAKTEPAAGLTAGPTATPTAAPSPATLGARSDQAPALRLTDSMGSAQGAVAAGKADSRTEAKQQGNGMPARRFAAAPPNPFTGNTASGPRAPLQMQNNAQVQLQNNAQENRGIVAGPATRDANAAPVSQVQGAFQTVEVQNAAPAIQPELKSMSTDQMNQGASAYYSATQVGKAKAAGEQAWRGTPTPKVLNAPGTKFDQLGELDTHPVSSWSINSSGTLQHSLDRGHTWQAVDVTATPAPAAAALTSANGAFANIADENKDKDSREKALKKTATPVFRAVAAFGTDVWAGGSGGALFHSVDGGVRWTRVIPSAAGTSLTGDIVSVEFSDQENGRITTSTPEVWTTADAGTTWQKQ